MRQNRIYVAGKLAPEESLSLAGNRAHYLHRVLRLGEGDNITLFNGDGWDYAATIVSRGKDQVNIEVSAQLPAAPESPLQLTLVQALARGERMDLSLQKATELGVSKIQPLLSERVEVKLSGHRLEKRMHHWRGVIISACEQSGRAKLPDLCAPLALGDWLASERPEHSYALHPRSEDSLVSVLSAAKPIALLVGPEGGFSEIEVLLMQAAGVRPVSFGRRILRTETAGPAAIAAIQSQVGDMA